MFGEEIILNIDHIIFINGDTMLNTAKLEVNQKSIELPLVKGSEGEIGVDISKLRSQTKAITIDPGFVNTGSCESSITFLDGGDCGRW